MSLINMATLPCCIVLFLTLTNISECVISRRARKIIADGEYTTIEKFPHAVYLKIDCDKQYYVCGASIVNQRLVITAANCLNTCDAAKDAIFCVVGHEDVGKAVGHKVLIFKWHEMYSEEKMTNDLALAMVQTLPLGDTLKRIVIPNHFPQKAKHKRVSVAGWGNHEDNTEDNKLRTVDQVIRDFKTCDKVLGGIEIGTFCAGEIHNTNYRLNFADSGSGLVYETTILLGVTSYQVQGHLSLTVYTNVTYFYPWIEETVETLYCENNVNSTVVNFT